MEDAIHNALEDLRSGKYSFHKAELKYGIPKSTLNDYMTGRVEIGKRQGPPPVLRKDEEQYLVNCHTQFIHFNCPWAAEMNKIGYGQTRRQICEMGKKKSYTRMVGQIPLKITALEKTGGMLFQPAIILS